MSGRKNFKILSDQLRADPERRAMAEEFDRAIRVALKLANLREARGVTQRQLAQELDVSQAHVSQVEHKEDLYLSTLSRYVAALGGRLEVTAVFPDQTIRLTATPASTVQGVNRDAVGWPCLAFDAGRFHRLVDFAVVADAPLALVIFTTSCRRAGIRFSSDASSPPVISGPGKLNL